MLQLCSMEIDLSTEALCMQLVSPQPSAAEGEGDSQRGCIFYISIYWRRIKMKKWIPITLAVLLTTGTVAGCSSGTTASPEASKATADQSTKDELKDKLELNIMAISYEGGDGRPAIR